VPVSQARIEPGEEGIARLMLDRPIGTLARDRLVLRDAAATRTIGGGIVIDPFPPRRRRRTDARLAVLRALDAPEPAAALGQLLALAPGWTEKAPFARARNLPPPEAETVLAAAGAETLGDLAIARPIRARLESALMETLAAHHAAAPDQPGLQPERVRLLLPGRPPAAGFRALLEAALRDRHIEQDGPWLRLPSHRATLSPADEALWRCVRAALLADRFRPPRARDLARAFSIAETDMRATLKRLQRMGLLIEVAHDHFFLRETVAEMAALIADVAAADPGRVVRAAAFRDCVENGRKVAIQILEFMDRAGITIRTGDERRVRPDRLDLFGPAPLPPPAPASRPAA
jgi:selenocysteine-specific elongation factor